MDIILNIMSETAELILNILCCFCSLLESYGRHQIPITRPTINTVRIEPPPIVNNYIHPPSIAKESYNPPPIIL
jgi:hypothetical protein